MNKVLYIILISFFSLTIYSCSSSDDGASTTSDNTTTSDDTTSNDDTSDDDNSTSTDNTTTDTTAPTVTSVSTTADNQSSVLITDNITVTFSEAMDTTYVTTRTSDTNCAGTIRVSSDNFNTCVRMSSEPASSNSNKTFTLDPYDNLTVGTTYLTRVTTGVKDVAGNALSSQYDNSTGFAPADLTAPTVSSVSTTADNQSLVSITDNIIVTFSEAMDTTYVTTNTDNTSCYGTLEVSSDNFSSCVQMSSAPASSSDNITFTLDPSDNLTFSTTYKTRVTTGVKDVAGNALSSQYQTTNGFTTIIEPEPVWSFAHNIDKVPTNHSVVGTDISLDSNSNVYIAVRSTANLDGNTNFGNQWSGNERSDSFVVKYSSAGSKLWLRQIGSVDNDDSVGIVADNSNAIYLLGEYSGRNTNTFDNQTNSYYQRVYLIKFDNSGNQLWFKTLGAGSSALQASEIIFDNNSILFSGNTDNGLEDGIGGMNSQKGNKDVYLAKISKEGEFQWIKQYGESGKSFENPGLQPDGSGNYYLTSNYNNDISIFKISSVGAEIWKKEINNSGTQTVNDIVVDSEGDILITGLTNTSFNSNDMVGEEDLYVAKLNSDAQIIWSKQLGVTSSQPKNCIVNGISVDSKNNIYIAGSTYANFDGNSRVDSREETDNIFVKFDKNGNKQWSKQFGSSGYDDSYDIVITKWDSSLTLTFQSGYPKIYKFNANGSQM